MTICDLHWTSIPERFRYYTESGVNAHCFHTRWHSENWESAFDLFGIVFALDGIVFNNKRSSSVLRDFTRTTEIWSLRDMEWFWQPLFIVRILHRSFFSAFSFFEISCRPLFSNSMMVQMMVLKCVTTQCQQLKPWNVELGVCGIKKWKWF